MKNIGTKKILLTGGGTAGHVTPNLAIIPLLRRHGCDIRYIGTKSGIEATLIAREGIPYCSIPAGKLRRYLDRRNFFDIFRIAAGFVKALFLVAVIRPHVLFSKGGFVACPVVWASWLLRVPVIVHESDISPGLANRLSLPFAKTICCSFPETAALLPAGKALLTGIPVREMLLRGDAAKGRALCNGADEKPLLLAIGGSQGAQAVNACLRATLPRLLRTFNVCHLCGKGNLAEEQPGYRQFEYADQELADLFAAADIALSRAGATALFELLALKKPALLIPLPLSASRGDQILNAQSFEKRGFSLVLPQERLTPETLEDNILRLFEMRSLLESRMAAHVAVPAAETIAALIEDTAGEKG